MVMKDMYCTYQAFQAGSPVIHFNNNVMITFLCEYLLSLGKYTDYCTLAQALSEAHDPFSDVLDDDQEGEEPRGNQDTYWSEKDRRVIAPCQGLMKASAACLRKLTSAVKANGDVTTPQNLAQLDDLADITKEISPR